MAKAASGEVTLEVGGETYLLRLDVEGMMDLEDRLDMSIVDLANELGSGKTPRIRTMVSILQVMIQGAELSASEVWDLFTSDKDAVASAMGKVFERSFNLGPEKPGKRPPAARKKPRK